MLLLLLTVSALGIAAVSISSTEWILNSDEFRSSLMLPRAKPAASEGSVVIGDPLFLEDTSSAEEIEAVPEGTAQAIPDTIFTGIVEDQVADAD